METKIKKFSILFPPTGEKFYLHKKFQQEINAHISIHIISNLTVVGVLCTVPYLGQHFLAVGEPVFQAETLFDPRQVDHVDLNNKNNFIEKTCIQSKNNKL